MSSEFQFVGWTAAILTEVHSYEGTFCKPHGPHDNRGAI
jgi:hypothetical protein